MSNIDTNEASPTEMTNAAAATTRGARFFFVLFAFALTSLGAFTAPLPLWASIWTVALGVLFAGAVFLVPRAGLRAVELATVAVTSSALVAAYVVAPETAEGVKVDAGHAFLLVLLVLPTLDLASNHRIESVRLLVGFAKLGTIIGAVVVSPRLAKELLKRQ